MSTFKHGVMMLRRGKPPFRTEDTSFDDATEHTGTIVAGSALGFIVCMFALGIPLTILFLPILWRIILRIWFLFIILAIVIAICPRKWRSQQPQELELFRIIQILQWS
eukprot:TRINITY_DN7867_c0_g1_i3.p2 TRINITY_DN7867_c0_g1~~TRINITY_DN7867_c0_g1_i3.p2  ORF type:complete len:108 (-),score=10.01 TRINITY_DN7867_c0_g1_i3:644-967(-)